MATGSNIRVGDADRDATATQLREHYAAGRLTLDELNERLEQTFAARTGADLNAVLRDLPSRRRLGPRGGRRRTARWAPRSCAATEGSGIRRRGTRVSGTRVLAAARHGYSALGMLVPVMLAIWAVLLLGGAFGFGFGGSRPLAIVLLLAVVGMIRRMFGGRGGYGRPHGRRCGRRW